MKEFNEGVKNETHIGSEDFREKMAYAWLSIHPEKTQETWEQVEKIHEEKRNLDKNIDKRTVPEILKEYGYDSTKIKELEKNIWELPVEKQITGLQIPEGYAVKGGAARALLLKNIGIDSSGEFRDMDIVRIEEWNKDDSRDEEIAETYMPDDFQFGHGVEKIETIKEYFKTRDFSINEVLATNKKIIATKKCIADSIRHIIRLTDFEKNNWGVSHKMLSKALALYSEAIQKYDTAKIENIEDWEYEEYSITPFWLALQLDRAFEKSSRIAEQLTSELKKKGQLPQSCETAEDAVRFLEELIISEDGSFYFRHAPIAQFEKEKEFMKKYEHLETILEK